VEIQFARLQRLVADQGIDLELGEEAAERLAALGYDPVYGARPLKRLIQDRVQNPLSMKLLTGEVGPGDRLSLDVDQGEFVFRSCEPAAGTRTGDDGTVS
jgi:ATP-dependent Clp protease ATP-binding subunit ClpB